MNFGIPIPRVFLDGRVDTGVIRDSLQLAENADCTARGRRTRLSAMSKCR